MTVSQIFKTVAQSEKFQFGPIFQSKTKILSIIAGWLSCVSIDSSRVQRMYMAKNSQQVREAYSISVILEITIKIIFVFMGIVACIGYDNLSSPNMIWPAIISGSSPFFKGLLLISLFAMVMSSADSILNAASSMFAHDLVNPLRKNKLTDKQQLYLAKITCFIIGILSISLTLFISKYSHALFRLLFLIMNIRNPIFVAPFFLAVFGFRCKEKIAVLGMIVGTITIILWNKFIPNIDGSFVAMLANGITMILAHYSLPKKDRQDWAKPSLDYQQSQQSRQRKFYRFKKYMAKLFSSLQYTPSNSNHIVLLAFYILITSWIPLFNRNMLGISGNFNNCHLIYWPLIQCLVALSMIIAVVLNSKRMSHNRYVWLSILVLCLPMDAIWHMTYAQDQRVAFALALCHFGVLMLLLPIYFNLAVLALCLSVAAIAGFNTRGLITAYIANIELFLPATLFLASAIYAQHKYIRSNRQVRLLEAQQQKAIEQEIQRSNMLHYLDMVTTEQFSEADILAKISAEQAHFFADMDPRQLQHNHIADAMDRFINFAAFFDERSKLAQGYLHLVPQSIDLYDLVNRLETTLETSCNYLPKLFVGPTLALSTKLTCDVELLTQALKSIVLDLLDEHYEQRSVQQQIISIAFFATQVKFSQSNLHDPHTSHLQGAYPAIAIRLYNATTYNYPLPDIQDSYDETTQDIIYPDAVEQDEQVKAGDLAKKYIRSIISAHYGYYLDRFTKEDHEDFQTFVAHQSHSSSFPKLVIIPQDSAMLQKDIIKQVPCTQRSQEDAQAMGDMVMALMDFQDFMVNKVQINQSILSNILYLLKKAYGTNKHEGGQFLLLRAIAIAKKVATLTKDHTAIYASLLYDLPYYSWIPLSYIRANYDIVIASLVEELLLMKSGQRQEKYQQAIAHNHLDIVGIKLVERCYDLEHADGYEDRQHVKTLAQETLEVDLPIARQYFIDAAGIKLAEQLEIAALQILR